MWKIWSYTYLMKSIRRLLWNICTPRIVAKLSPFWTGFWRILIHAQNLDLGETNGVKEIHNWIFFFSTTFFLMPHICCITRQDLYGHTLSSWIDLMKYLFMCAKQYKPSFFWILLSIPSFRNFNLESVQYWVSGWTLNKCIIYRGVIPGGAGGAMADQFTLSQPGGADYPHQIMLAHLDFQTFLRPWYIIWILQTVLYFKKSDHCKKALSI